MTRWVRMWIGGMRAGKMRLGMMGFGRLAGEGGCGAEFIPFFAHRQGSLRRSSAPSFRWPPINGTWTRKSILTDLCRGISGMVLNFIVHLQGTGHPAEKANRPRRLTLESHQRGRKSCVPSSSPAFTPSSNETMLLPSSE